MDEASLVLLCITVHCAGRMLEVKKNIKFTTQMIKRNEQLHFGTRAE